ncbi:gamma-glutamylcysteine synthetase, partial [Streptococcus devriesei]
MTKAIDLLKKRYLDNIKEAPEAYIGIELEFPIVNLKQEATDLHVTKSLLSYLPQVLPFEAEKYDTDGQPIQLVNKSSEDRILFEVSYNTIEFALGKVKRIQDAEKRFNGYLETVQNFLGQYHHAIQGFGVHPYWNLNDNSAVKLPRYQMLLDFLALSKNKKDAFLHKFPQYGSFICGNQVQLDVSKENYLRVINAFNKIEAAKAYLFANSEFWGENWPFKISRDIFWENSMHGIFKENVGVNSRSFKTEDDFFNYLAGSAVFNAEREGELYYFEPIRVRDYLLKKDISAWNLKGEKAILFPQEADLEYHRSYQYQNLTKRGTVEFRSVCTQPLNQTFAPIAFHVGLLANLDKLEDLLANSEFLSAYHQDYRHIRHLSIGREQSPAFLRALKVFASSLLACSLSGLTARGYGEEG